MKEELYKKSSVIDLNLIDRTHRLNSTDAELILMIVTYFLENMERSKVHEINIVDVIDLIDEKLTVIENRKE